MIRTTTPVFLATLFTAALVSGGQAGEQSVGAAEYAASCAACHGANGKGFGPLSNELSRKPADLTVLRSNNGGEFPYYLVVATIDGRYVVPGHGERDMPVWGNRYLQEEKPKLGQKGAEIAIRERILEIAKYIETLQAEADGKPR